MSKFLTERDIWGIRQAVNMIWWKNRYKGNDTRFQVEEYLPIYFDAFFNQIVPRAFRETRQTVIRHEKEIAKLASQEQNLVIWFKNGNQYKAGMMNDDLKRRIKNGLTLPTYQEIEEEKMRWQQSPKYKKEQGFSQPIEEEFVQLRIQKK